MSRYIDTSKIVLTEKTDFYPAVTKYTSCNKNHKEWK